MPKLPDYEERSAKYAAECAELDRLTIQQVNQILRDGLKDSADKLISLTSSSDESIRLQAVKHHLKLGGFEVERVEHQGDGIKVYLPEVAK